MTCPQGSYYNSGSKDCKKIEHDHCSVQYFPCSQICVEGKDGTSASCECMEGQGKNNKIILFIIDAHAGAWSL